MRMRLGLIITFSMIQVSGDENGMGVFANIASSFNFVLWGKLHGMVVLVELAL